MEIPVWFARNSGADFPRHAVAVAAASDRGYNNRFNPSTLNTVRLRLFSTERRGP
jgi:hypothetical protein